MDADINTDTKSDTTETPGDITNDKPDDDKTNDTKKINVGGFFKSMTRFVIYISIIVFLGTSFRIILSHYDPSKENPNVFPGMNINDVPYSEGTKKTSTDSTNIQGLSRLFHNFFPMNRWSFPYKNRYSKKTEPGIFGNIILWLTESIAYSNQYIRRLTGTIIEGLADYKDNTYAFWTIGLLILLTSPFIPVIGLIYGFVGPVMAIDRIWVGWKVFLLLCLPFLIPASLYAFSLFTTASFLAYMQSVYTVIMALVFLLVFPYSLPNSSILFKETLTQHRFGILRAVLLAAVINAFRYLNSGIGIGALLLFILSLFGLV
jgi:hypothetical protein